LYISQVCLAFAIFLLMFRVFLIIFSYCLCFGVISTDALGSRVSVDPPKPIKKRVAPHRQSAPKKVIARPVSADALLPPAPTLPSAPTASAVSATVRQALLRELDHVRSSIMADRHGTALAMLQHLSERIRAIQTDVIDSYFPESVGELTVKGRPSLDYVSDRFGVIFSRRYSHYSEDYLDVSVVHLDPSIREYWDMVKNPKLASHIDTAKIIEIQDGYRGLEKSNTSLGLVERNIVLSDTLMVNIVANGKNADSLISEYTRQVQFAKLKRYLQD